MKPVARPSLAVALSMAAAVLACGDDGPTQTVQRGCGQSSQPSTLFQLGSPVDLDTCEPDFSSRTVVINVETAVDAIRAPLSMELLTGDGDVLVYPDGGDAADSPESATLRLDRFVLDDGASGSLILVEEGGSESTLELEAVWCDRAAGPPACD